MVRGHNAAHFGFHGDLVDEQIAQRHMAEFGTTRDQLGAIVTACRKHGAANPNAQLRKPLAATADRLVAIGHAQLLRRAIAHELRFSCRLESNLLSGALEALNGALLADMRRAYRAADAHPLPGAGGDGLLPAAADYCEAAGIAEPLTKVYLPPPAEPPPHMGLWLAAAAIAVAPRFLYDRDFGTLVRRKLGEPVDGAPLVAGLVTLLKQQHPAVTHDWLAYTALHVRAAVAAAAGAARPAPLPIDAALLLLLVQHVTRVARIPDHVVHAHFPPYLFETAGTLG
jgi:WASH complex subunit strumpellin